MGNYFRDLQGIARHSIGGEFERFDQQEIVDELNRLEEWGESESKHIRELLAKIAQLEAVAEAAPTPNQMDGLADWIIKHGDLDSNSHCLSALALREKAKAMRAALAALRDGGDRG